MSTPIQVYNQHLQRQLEKISATIDGLDRRLLDWRPTVGEANTIAALVTHVFGNVRAWVLGVSCGQPVERDRAAEFRAKGLDASELIERTRAIGREAELALSQLDLATLDELRDVHAHLTSRRPNEPVSGRQAIVHSIAHAAEHLGHIELTRDLARAAVGVS